jgi:flagellar biosynthesis protein FlhA
MATAGYAAWLLRSKSVEQRREREREIAEAEAPREERVEDYLAVDTLSVEIGYGLIPLVDESQGGDFLDRVTTLRRQIAQELGVIVPPVRIRDNIRLEGNDYIIMIKGNEVARGQVEANMYLAMNPGGDQSEVEGKTTVEPAFGLPAKWISSKEREKAELNGWTVVEPSSVLATHLSEIIKKHAYEIITRQDVQQLVDSVRQDYPVLVDELIPGQLGLGTLQRVLQHLLKEQIPIRDLVTILETIGDYAANTKDPNTLGEFARVALYRTITRMYIDDENKMTVFTLSPQLERMIMENMQNTSQGVIVNLSPAVSEKMLTNVGAIFEQMLANDQQPIALTSASIRFAFRTMTEISFPRLAVLSYNEVAPEIEIFSVGMVKVE